MSAINFNVDLSQLEAMIAHAQEICANPMGDPTVAQGVNDAADIYDAAMVERYDIAMRGPGIWTDIAPLTKREKTKYGQVPNLINVSADFPALDHEPGQLERSMHTDDPNHVREPTDTGVLTGTAVDYAERVQVGDWADHLPERPILVRPDGETLAAMTDVMASAVARSMGGIGMETDSATAPSSDDIPF
jgi:hypothetical protein